MSTTLGKIHFWMYNKIQWYEHLEEDIIAWAREVPEFTLDDWIKHMDEDFGRPTGGKPLEEIIDQSNIHGWLQSKVEAAELRQAYLVTRILTAKGNAKGELVKIYQKQGIKAGLVYPEKPKTPEGLYKAMTDFILEGMPCDNVNEIIHNTEDFISWKTTECLHTPHWERVKGEVGNFYDLREEWIKAFIKTLNPDFRYEKLPDGTHRIINHSKGEKEG